MEAYKTRALTLLYSSSEYAQARLQQVPMPTMLQACVAGLALLATAVYLILYSASAVAARPRHYVVPAPDTTSLPPAPKTSPIPAAAAAAAATDSSPSHVDCYAPATGQFLGRVRAATTADVDAAVAAAAAAQRRGWGPTTTTAQRQAVLRTLLAHVLDHAREICRVAGLDSGKPAADAHLGEVLTTVERLRWTLRHGPAALAPERRAVTSPLMRWQKRGLVRYEPMGVVAALVSWNYPFHNLIGPVASGLFAGNAVVVKVSEQTAWSAAYFADIARGALVAHGFSPDLVQVLVCWPREAAHLAAHPGLSHLTFIGSRPVARHVAAAAATALTPVVAELGGKDPCIVLDSAAADLDRIIEVILRGTFQAAGQNCVGIERIVAARGPVYDALVERLAPRVRALRLGPGDDADVGAMISSASFDRLEGLIRDAVDRGARLLAGGTRYTHPEYPAATYFQPTMLVDVTPDMAISRHECFAPVLTLMRAATSTPEAMLAIANANTDSTDTDSTDTDSTDADVPRFGLGASVFGNERTDRTAIAAIVRGLHAGMVSVNDFAAYYAVQLPFGGVRGSGYGRFAGIEGLRGLCNAKSVCEDRFGWLGVRTTIPPALRYPIAGGQERAWRFVHAVVELGYALTTARRVRALVELLRNM